MPGAIFSYPILRQEGEPILDEAPPMRGPHMPVMPDLSATEEDDDSAEDADIRIIPEQKQPQDPRRSKIVGALRSLHNKISGT